MASANLRNVVMSERHAVRRALSVERARATHCREALARAKGGKLRGRYRRKLDATLGRAAKLALALVDMGEEIPMAQVYTEFDSRLLDAMDLAMRKHVSRARAIRVCGRAAGPPAPSAYRAT